MFSPKFLVKSSFLSLQLVLEFYYNTFIIPLRTLHATSYSDISGELLALRGNIRSSDIQRDVEVKTVGEEIGRFGVEHEKRPHQHEKRRSDSVASHNIASLRRLQRRYLVSARQICYMCPFARKRLKVILEVIDGRLSSQQ